MPKARSSPPGLKKPKSPPTPLEPDKGFGESHGYGPGHGGPTSPGDAPATEPPKVVPADDASDKEEP